MSGKPVENHLKTAGESLEFVGKVEVTNRISPRCVEVFEELKIRRRHRYIIFKLGEEEIEVESVGGRKETYDEFKRALPFSDCRYGIYDQDYRTADGRPASKLWFVSWFPKNATTHNKMAYTSAKGKFREVLLGAFDVQVSSLEEMDSAIMGEEEEEEGDFEF
eukprot:gene33449-40467_t